MKFWIGLLIGIAVSAAGAQDYPSRGAAGPPGSSIPTFPGGGAGGGTGSSIPYGGPSGGMQMYGRRIDGGWTTIKVDANGYVICSPGPKQ